MRYAIDTKSNAPLHRFLTLALRGWVRETCEILHSRGDLQKQTIAREAGVDRNSVTRLFKALDFEDEYRKVRK